MKLIYDLKLSRRQHKMKPSRAISRENMGLASDVSETLSPSTGVDVMSVVFARYIYTLSKQLAPPERTAWGTMGVVSLTSNKPNIDMANGPAIIHCPHYVHFSILLELSPF
jgi:hypothetical protein